MTEDEFLTAVLDLAEQFGWRAMHPRPARTQHGWRTAVQGPGSKGWPDLVLCHADTGVFLVRELKAQTGPLSIDQLDWICALEDCGVDVGVWRPGDWPSIAATLTHGRGEAL